MNQLNQELLYDIDNINLVVQESEHHVLMSMMGAYEKTMIYLECSNDFEESLSYFMESGESGGTLHQIGSGLKKLGSQIWSMIIGLLKRIGGIFGHIIDGLRGLIGKDPKHGPKKTTAQILDENDNIMPRKDIDLSKFRKRKVSMPLDPSSEETVPTVNMYTSTLLTQINSDGTYELKTSRLFKDMIKYYLGGDSGKVASQIPGYTQATPVAIMMFKNYEGCMDHIVNAIQILEAMFKNKISVKEGEDKFMSQISYVVDLGRSKSHVMKNLSLKFTLAEMQSFQKKLADLTSHVASEAAMIQKSEDDPSFKLSPEMITDINYLTAMMMYMQTVMNTYSLSLNDIWVIPEEYTATINDFDVMGEFVNSMINAGIPSKYIMLNAWLAGTREFTGNPGTYDEEKSSKYKPAMGHCRGCFFPEALTDSVYKIALNKRGTQDIENEYWVTNKVKGTPLETKFAVIKKVNKYNTICEMEKIKTLEAKDTPKYAAETDKIIKMIDEHLNFVVHDLHTLNFGIRIKPEASLPGSVANEFIVSDYGALRFKEAKKDKHNEGD